SNVAACLKALGSTVHCSGVVGDDVAGRRLRALLEGMGIDGAGCVVSEARQTITKTRFVGLAQHRHRQQLLRLDDEITTPFPSQISDRILEAVEHALGEADVVCIEDYDKGLITSELVAAIVRNARRADRPVLADPARLPDFGRYQGVTLLTPNRAELELAAGKSFDDTEAVMRACPGLLDGWRVDGSIVTLDRDGAVLARTGHEPVHVPTRVRSVYDNTGAGDAVLATLAACVAVGADLESAVRLANIAGGLEVERFGCVPITADEMLADLRLEDNRRNGKLRSLEELEAELTLRRDRGETVVFTNGVFDLLHPGHVDYLSRAREEGGLLVVGINSDVSAKKLRKGNDRPINDERFRVRMLGALECVDYVVVFNEPDPLNLIKRIRPDVLVKGEDWATKGVVGREFVESRGGRVKLIPLSEGYSTTSIIERIRSGRT
ncbi:MAG: D-glycero-beta-D-manno-heptose 1-phosphate adenylyltransferase, partial [Planctomycetes bacterium]|nr:D-glycero-beta-D-manno-heptose 1-phosphate adenylyltransferase [Planctomycetota bacterium]